jgi:hypothetical protein
MYSRCVKRVFYSAFVGKCTDKCKYRFRVQLLQNPPLCSSTEKSRIRIHSNTVCHWIRNTGLDVQWGIPLINKSSIDMEGVSLSTTSSMDVQGLFLPPAMLTYSTGCIPVHMPDCPRHPVSPVPDWTKKLITEPVRYRKKRGTQSATGVEILDAGMPMPGYAICLYHTCSLSVSVVCLNAWSSMSACHDAYICSRRSPNF